MDQIRLKIHTVYNIHPIIIQHLSTPHSLLIKKYNCSRQKRISETICPGLAGDQPTGVACWSFYERLQGVKGVREDLCHFSFDVCLIFRFKGQLLFSNDLACKRVCPFKFVFVRLLRIAKKAYWVKKHDTLYRGLIKNCYMVYQSDLSFWRTNVKMDITLS